MSNFLFRHSKLAAVLAASAIAAVFAATNAGAFDEARRFVVAQAVEKASGEGVIKGVKADEHKIMMTHGPIPALQWPAMTMAFNVAPEVDLSGLAPGAKVKFTLTRDAKGLYVIDQLTRAE
jgi:Cu/Ag efflux protein CusF